MTIGLVFVFQSYNVCTVGEGSERTELENLLIVEFVYEGDTERMLIKHILQLPEFEALRNQYVSFVQVGGAYGYNYRPIIDFLGMRFWLLDHKEIDNERIKFLFILYQLEMYIDEVTIT